MVSEIIKKIPNKFRGMFDVQMDLETIYVIMHQIITEQPEERSSIVPTMSYVANILFPAYKNATHLFHHGYVVVPLLDNTIVRQWRSDIRNDIKSFPEYKNTQYPVLGGFAALGNAASFHHPDIRKKRHFIYNHIRSTLLYDYSIITGDEDTLKSELLFDRIMWRQVGQIPSKESWHRDVTAKPPKSSLQDGDRVLGGWTNLDDTDQFFSCVPGTHLDSTLFDTVHTGFCKITKEDCAVYKKRSMCVNIPSGHCLVFFQHLVHEVIASKTLHDMYRIFHGFRLTHFDVPLFHNDYTKRRVFQDQAIPRLPSFQLPPMYSANHGSVFLGLPQDTAVSTQLVGKFTLPGQYVKTNTVQWSANTFNSSSIHTKSRKKQDQPDFRYNIVRRFMNSLVEDGYRKYKAYSQEELSLYTPTRISEKYKDRQVFRVLLERDEDGDIVSCFKTLLDKGSTINESFKVDTTYRRLLDDERVDAPEYWTPYIKHSYLSPKLIHVKSQYSEMDGEHILANQDNFQDITKPNDIIEQLFTSFRTGFGPYTEIGGFHHGWSYEINNDLLMIDAEIFNRLSVTSRRKLCDSISEDSLIFPSIWICV